MVTVWWSTASLIHYRFLNPGESITSEKSAQEIDEMHQKLSWSTERAQFFTTIMPDHAFYNRWFRS